MRNLCLVVVLILMTTAKTYGQNFLPGYIVDSKNDTVKGSIDYKGWEFNPTKISFKDAAGKEQVFTKTDISGFGINGYDHYVREFVTLDMNPVTADEVIKNIKDATLSDTVFLRVLVIGDKFDLYEFLNFKPHFFIRFENGPIEPLIYRVSFDEGSGRLIFDKRYQNQLNLYLGKMGIENRNLDNLNYEAKPLSKFIKPYNSPGSVYEPKQEQKLKNITRYFIGGGVVMGKLKFAGDNEVLTSLNFGTSTSYIVTGGADFYVSRNTEKFFFRTELSLSSFKADGTGTSGDPGDITKFDHTYNLKQTNITPAVSFNFNFVNAKKAQAYVGFGAGYNISSYSTHRLTSKNRLTGAEGVRDDLPKVENGWAAVYGRLGLFISKKFEVGIAARLTGSFVSTLQTKEANGPIFFRVYYRF